MTTLYKQTKSGAVQTWSIQTLPNGRFQVTFGQLGGAMQTQVTKCEPKNLGRANATMPDEQAELEVAALITKKLKSGYSYDQSAPIVAALPMKVKSYQDQLHNVTFPCYSTPKLNGVNGLYRRDPVTKQLNLYSRGGELYPAIPHLESDIHLLMDALDSHELNGELYIHGAYLQDIQSAVTKPNQLSSKLTFTVFDIADSADVYSVRRQKLLDVEYLFEETPIAFLTGVECDCESDIESHYNQCMASKLEGTVIKLPNGLYKHNIRSSEQFKYKKAQSAEFLITGYELDKRNHPVFILQSANKSFKAKPKGTHAFIESIDPDSYVNQWATIEFEVFSKDLVPLKPIFIGLRKCDESGNPLE
jgi:ATP-dependent DNA ligase